MLPGIADGTHDRPRSADAACLTERPTWNVT
jgi:hypothetical protein